MHGPFGVRAGGQQGVTSEGGLEGGGARVWGGWAKGLCSFLSCYEACWLLQQDLTHHNSRDINMLYQLLQKEQQDLSQVWAGGMPSSEKQ